MQHPRCSSFMLILIVQVSYSSDDQDCEAGDPAFQPSARMPPSSLTTVEDVRYFKASHAVSFVEMKTQ